jgi:hypothetical protein
VTDGSPSGVPRFGGTMPCHPSSHVSAVGFCEPLLQPSSSPFLFFILFFCFFCLGCPFGVVHSFICSFIYLFSQHVYLEHLLHTKHCSGHVPYISAKLEQQQNSCSHRPSVLLVEDGWQTQWMNYIVGRKVVNTMGKNWVKWRGPFAF